VASFGLGLLIGQRSTLPDDVGTQLAAVGLTHLIAVSGYNLTIIIDAVRRLTARFSKYQSTVIALALVGLFLLTTGMSASIVRASIVSGLGIWAWYYGRAIKPVLLISFAAALTAGWSPLYLWGDIGWYLSFLAFFGVLVIAPLVTKRIYAAREPRFLQAIFIETTCAQIMTLPLILYIFQQVSFISLIANVLVIPLVPIAMLVSLMAGLAGMWVPAVAGWFAWPAQMILTYMLDISAMLSRVPHAVAKYALSLTALVFLYGVIIVMLLVMWRKIRQKYGIITEKESVK
jgi:competence protein ComEC